MTNTVVIVAATLTFLATFPANAQKFSNVDREYEEAEHLCKRLLDTGWKRLANNMSISECIAKRLGLHESTKSYDVNVNRR